MSHNQQHAMDSSADHSNPTDDWTLVFPAGKTLEISPAVYDDLRIGPGAFEFSGGSDPVLRAWQPGGAGATYRVYSFATGDEVFFAAQVPHTYKEATDLEPHVHWTPRDRGVIESGKTVNWRLDASWANVGDPFPASTTYDLTGTCSGVDDEHEIPVIDTMTGTGKLISSMILGRLYRLAGDSWAGGVLNEPSVLEIDFHFQVNTLGSRQKFVK